MFSKCLPRPTIFSCLGCAGGTFHNASPTVLNNSIRHVTAECWSRAYLKDLFHRRQMVGPEPLRSRASEDNWNYPSEISALSHRLHMPDMDNAVIVRALTDKSYFTRKDLDNDETMGDGGPLTAEHGEGCSALIKDQSNVELADKGLLLFRHIVLSYLRAHWSFAPEEFIVGVATRIASTAALAEVATQLGLQHVVRTAEFPPAQQTLQEALLALVGAMDVTKAREFVRRFVLPRLYEVPLEDVLPFRNPFHVLREYLCKWHGVTDIEARTVESGAVLTSMPFYEVAIYAEKKRIVGQSGGEYPWVALDLAAQDGLLRLWQVSDHPRAFPFKFEEAYASRFEQAQQTNHQLSEVCGENIDLSLYTPEQLAMDPIDMVDVSKQYFTQIRPEAGIPHRRRLRHLFSRGTLNQLSVRRQVLPTPHTI